MTFEARNSRWRLALLLMGALAFVAVGIWMAGLFGVPPEPGEAWIGWVCVLFFGFCAIIAVRRMADDEVQLRVSGQGVMARQWSDQTIPWSEITDVSVWTYRRQKSIILHLRDPAKFPGSGLAGRLQSANRAMTGGDVAISLAGTDGKFDDAVQTIGQFMAIQS
jgi:hypothetical protein